MTEFFLLVLLVTGLIACLISFRVVQWIVSRDDDDDEECDDDTYYCLAQYEDEDDDEESD